MGARESEFVVGDLVRFCGVASQFPSVRQRIGIVMGVADVMYEYPRYKIFWLGENLITNHVALSLELVYNIDVIEKED